MNTDQFRKYAEIMVDKICDYMNTISNRDVWPIVQPGFMKDLIPNEPPLKHENFDDVLVDVEKKILPGLLHWNHPHFYGYFPSGNSFPSILADMLSSALGIIAFSWDSSPAATELETIMLNWYGKALRLPNIFLSDAPGSQGGGALQGSASESVFLAMMAARARTVKKLKGTNIAEHDNAFIHKLTAYSSKDAHSSVEKAAKMSFVKLRVLDVDENGRFRPELLKASIKADIDKGLVPFFVVATSGTTGSCAFDDLKEIGKICKEYPDIWYHVDGAYAGNSFILPEMRHFADGLELADSFQANPNKLLLINFDATGLWVRNVKEFTDALTVNPLYLENEFPEAIDYRHYGIPLSRRFRALKLWFVFRTYGINGLQAYVRNHKALAKILESLILNDERFEVMSPVHLGLVCFRLKGSDVINQELLARINYSAKLHMVPSMVRGKYTIRFCVTYEHATEDHINEAWARIRHHADEVFGTVKTLAKTKPPPVAKLTRPIIMRYSFSKNLSKDVYEKFRKFSNLTDDALKLYVKEDHEDSADGHASARSHETTNHPSTAHAPTTVPHAAAAHATATHTAAAHGTAHGTTSSV